MDKSRWEMYFMKNLQTSLFLRGILVLIVMILSSSCAPSVTEIVIPAATSDNLSIAQADWATRVAYVEPTFDASNCIGWGKLDDSYLAGCRRTQPMPLFDREAR
jgi:hypothetical protein